MIRIRNLLQIQQGKQNWKCPHTVLLNLERKATVPEHVALYYNSHIFIRSGQNKILRIQVLVGTFVPAEALWD